MSTDVTDSQPTATKPAAIDGLGPRLLRLFDVHRRPDGTRATLADVADAVTKNGTPLSVSYLSQLASGQRTNPSGLVLAGLAKHFRVNVGYLLGEPDAVEEVTAHLDLVEVMRNDHVRNLAVRASRLSPDALRALTAFVSHLEHPHEE